MAEVNCGAVPALPDTHHRFFVLVILGWVGYTAIWTTISILRLVAFRASVYDLGAFAQAGWRTYSANLTPFQLFMTIFNQGGSVFLSPLVLGGYDVILFAQSAALGIGGPLLFLIARRYGFGPRISAAIGGSYLIYFGLAGINFADAHYEAFLIPFFLGAFLLYLEGRFVASLILFLLAGLLQYPMATYPALFAILLAVPFGASFLLRQIQRRDRTTASPHSDRPSIVRRALTAIQNWRCGPAAPATPKWFATALLVGAGVTLLGGYFTNQLFYPLNDAATLAHISSINLGANFTQKFLTLILLFGSLAFIPLASPRWTLYCVPYIVTMFLSIYAAYYLPVMITSWYAWLFIPFLFLGLVDGLDKVQRRATWAHWLYARLRTRWSSTGNERAGPISARGGRAWQPYRSVAGKKNVTISGVLATLVLVLLVIPATFYTPYGPFNGGTDSSFHMASIWEANQTLYDQFLKLASLIPPSANSVILQDNMPQLLPRPLEPGSISPLVPGPFGQVAWNLTWPNPNGSWTPINPDYVIGNPNPLLDSFFSSQGPYPYNTSMAQILTDLYATYNYGILGEASGMLLLKHYYTGPIRYYMPFAADYSPSAFQSNFASRDLPSCGGISCWAATDLRAQQIAWYGPYAYLSPGVYNVSVHLGLANWKPGDRAEIEVTGENGIEVLNSTLLAGLTVGPQMASAYCNMTVFVGGATPGVEFRAVDSDFNGTLALYGVHVQEVAPPSTVYRIGNTPHDAAIYRLLGLVPRGSTVLSEPTLRPYFHNLTLVSVPPAGSVPAATYEIYDPTMPSSCVPNGNNSLCQVVNESFSSGAFSIVGQVDGVTLLGPHGSALEAYSPLSTTIPVSQLITHGAPGQNFTRESNGTLTINDQINGGYGWFGPYASLPPGNYTAELELSVTNTSPVNQMLIAVTSNWEQEALGTLWINGTSFTGSNETTIVTVPFSLTHFSNSIEIVGKEVNWSGVVTLFGIQLVQTAPPAPPR